MLLTVTLNGLEAVFTYSPAASRQRELKQWFHIPCLVRPHNRPPWASTIDRLIDSRQPHALGLRRIKGVEDPFCLLWIKTDASVSRTATDAPAPYLRDSGALVADP